MSDYVKVEYPKCLYHRDGSIKVVQDAKEHRRAGAGWAEQPFDGESADAPADDASSEQSEDKSDT